MQPTDKQPKDRPSAASVRVAQGSDNQRRTKFMTGALVVLALFTISFFGGWLGGQSWGDGTDRAVERQKVVLNNQAELVSSVAQEVGPSVVSVNVMAQQANADPFAELFGYSREGQTVRGAGTGVILNKEGLILTNRHVVPEGTTDVSVTLSDGTVLDKVKVIGRTPANDTLDIAFLQVQDLEGNTLTPATLGDSAEMEVGQSVIAIGNALGQFQNTVTTGIISGYGRSVQAAAGDRLESLDDLFQTDAAINEGNSGGPLVNLNSEVIGINTAVASGSQNIGFAIPINNVKGLIDSIKTTGKLERPYLGVMYILLTDDIAKEYELSVNRGAYIPESGEGQASSVIPGGPADKAGVQEGDVITQIDNIAIDEKRSLVSVLSSKKPGDTVRLTINRDGKTLTLPVELSASPQS
jgi:serine protease Do